jgi:mono/diheme cytochrome c family protein
MIMKKSEENIISGGGQAAAMTALFLILCCLTALAAPPDQGAQSVFKSTCTSCHGPNGMPSAVGKSLNAPDLGSTDVQRHTNTELQEIVGDGKGNMPPFRDKLSEAQIHSLVVYIRTFSKKHK